MRKLTLIILPGFITLGWLFFMTRGLLYAENNKKAFSSSKYPSYSPNELLIQFKSEITLSTSPIVGSNTTTRYTKLDSLNKSFKVKKIIPLFTSHNKESKQSEIQQIYLFKFDTILDTSDLRKKYQSLNMVNFVEFNYYYFADYTNLKNPSLSNKLQLKEAASYINPNNSIIIGIIDTGIDWKREHLISNLWKNPMEKLDGKDNDENGLIDDLWGWNFVDPDMLQKFGVNWEIMPIDDSGHGIPIAEIVNQISNYRPLETKDTSKNQLMILKAGARSPDGKIVFTTFSISQAIIYAADHNAKIINLSLGNEFPSHVLQQAIDYAVNKGCSIIASAGNEGRDKPHYPAAFENVWAVAATDGKDNKLESSNYGPWIDIAAPGLFPVLDKFSDSTKSEVSGTSIAAAHVSGLAGLLLSCEAIEDCDSLKRRIIWSSENIYHHNPDYSGLLGAGRINALRALNAKHQPNIVVQKISINLTSQTQYLLRVKIVPIIVTIKNLSSAAQYINLKLRTDDPYLTILHSEITLPELNYQQEYTNKQNPFTLVIDDDYPLAHQAKLIVDVETSNDFSVSKEFILPIRINAPRDLSIVHHNPVTLKWTSDPEFTGYHIYRKNNKQQTFLRISKFPIVDSSYIDYDIESDYRYFYYITGIDTGGWESPASDIVTIKYKETNQFQFFPTQDITISEQDSIRFLVLPKFSAVENYKYQWLINEHILTQEHNSTFVLFADSLSHDENLIKVMISGQDTIISHAWNVRGSQPSFDLDQVIFSPTSDTTIRSGDSLLFVINPVYEHMICEWFINDRLDLLQQKNSYFFQSPSDSNGVASVLVRIGIRDSSYFHQWLVFYKVFSHQDTEIRFFPTEDTTIYEGDSLNLFVRIPFQGDSLKNFQWLINGTIDSMAQQTNYIIRPDYFSTGVDTIVLNYEIGDSTLSHQWLITILNRNRPPEILSFTLPLDTTISIDDTLLFAVNVTDPDQDSLIYKWYVNDQLDSTAIDSFYKFYRLNNESNSDTILVKTSDNDTSINHSWVVNYLTNINQIPQIISYSPPLDSIVTKADSIQFQIYCEDPDGDTLQFTWFINNHVDTLAHDSTYLYRNIASSFTNDTLMVMIADADTNLSLEWILWGDTTEPKSNPPKIFSWYPEQDSLIADSDSLFFWVKNANDSCRFQWAINGRVDSTANDSTFIYHFREQSGSIDTINLTIFEKDTLFSRRWYVHYLNLSQPNIPLNLAFHPENDIIVSMPDDSMKFSVKIIDGEYSELNFLWQINSKIDTTVLDTIFYYKFTNFTTIPDTIKVTVSNSNTTFLNRWIVHGYPQKMLPPPNLIYPIKGNYITEEDALIWENDSSLAKSDSVGLWQYVVQLCKDTTFLELFSTDSCKTTNMVLNKVSGFDQIPIGQPIYWRVRIFSEYDKTSEFRKCSLPFSYYPMFAVIENFYGQKNEDGSIELFWTTSYEKNCAGFNVYRSETQDDNFKKINEQLIIEQKDYAFQDVTTKAGKTYYYKLEDISFTGRKKFHETISVTAPTPEKYSLSHNYPNPFNSITSFKYEIPTATHVTIAVYNVLGRKVKTLVDERKEPGFYTIYWDGIDDQGKNVVSGVYFYHMSTRKFNMTHKMIVVR